MTETDNRPACVFCGAPWTEEMLRLYDAGSNGAVCSCCVIFPDLEGYQAAAPEPPPRPHVPLPPELSCEACGRVLYRLFSQSAAGETAADLEKFG